MRPFRETPRITQGAVVKECVDPGRFRTVELPVTFTPRTPIQPRGALFGQVQVDLAEDRTRAFGRESGNHVGEKIRLALAIGDYDWTL